MLLELRLVLAGQLLVLPLELRDEDLPLDLLLLLQGEQLLLQLLLPHRSGDAAAALAGASQGAGGLLAGRGECRHLLLLQVLVVVHAQVHGDGGRGETQGQRRVDVHCRRRRSLESFYSQKEKTFYKLLSATRRQRDECQTG